VKASQLAAGRTLSARPDVTAPIQTASVIQESLTNVRKHAGGAPTQVAVRYGAKELEVEVRNDAGRAQAAMNGGGGGHGIFGMSERVRLFGGRFEAGEAAGGGFRVHALLPLEDVQA
jgi:signal transduction histidine kinase